MQRAADARRDRAFYAAVGAGVLAVVAFALARGGRPSDARTPDERDAIVPWCASTLEPIEGGGCFARPAAPGAALVVYLHGMHPPTAAGIAEELERQARVARLATARGFAVLALRGRQGQCLADGVRDWFCWPSNERTAEDGRGVVDAWTRALAGAERRGARGRRLLLGFSNGGYFAALIATRALMRFDAIAIAHGGPVEPVEARGAKPPVVLLTADEDASIESMMRLDRALSRAAWPHAIVTRDGGHALTEEDVEAALTFFERTARERLPLRPPLSTRPPRPRLPSSAPTEVIAAPGPDAPTGPALDAAPLPEAPEPPDAE